jgi:outer membrane protein OmpA-like peptidoglycan-associated protein
MNRFIAIVFAFFTIWCSAQSTKTEVLFKKDNYELTPKAKAKLDLVLQDLKAKNTKFEMLLVGHTDSDGSIEYNKKLSEQRTNEVYHYLLEKGVHQSAIKINYFGEEKPKVANSDEDNNQYQ